MKLGHELTKKLFVGGELGESGDIGYGDNFVVHDTGLDLEVFMIFGKLGEDLGGRNGVGTKENSGWAIEETVKGVGELFGLLFES